MKTYTATRIIIVLSFIVFLFSCQKNSGNPSQGGKHCYLARAQQLNDITDYIYNPDHSLQRTELYTAGNHGTRTVYELSLHAGQYREDLYSYAANVKNGHPGYGIGYVNGSGSLDSAVRYACVDCGLSQPTTYNISYGERYKYDGQQRLIRIDAFNTNHVVYSYSLLDYDAKGRLIKSRTFEPNGDPINSNDLAYDPDDAKNYSLGEPNAYYTAIYHNELGIQPVLVTVHDETGDIIQEAHYVNTPTPEGYLASSSITIGGITHPLVTYSYECFH
jgi:hypothetical protein